MSDPGRYFRTLRHLRWQQLAGQVRVRVQRVLRDPARMPAGGGLEWPGSCENGYGHAPVPGQDAEELAAGRFCFVGLSADLGASPDWTAPGLPRLWQYNLHYFDWLWSLSQGECAGWEDARRLTADWIDRHPPLRGACGWEPYPLSLRLMNWSLLFCGRYWEMVGMDAEFRDKLTASVNRQVEWLGRNLETHIQANHLLENLAALVCVGSLWSGEGAERLLGRVVPLLEREVGEQVLADGMHYERSPMYHLRMLWVLDMLGGVGSGRVREVVRECVGRMRLALGCLRHPDGGVALLNDAALGVYSDPWSGDGEEGAWALPDAGYYGMRSGGDYVVVDAGAVGPDHQPGHAHADYFSFEMSLEGERVVTDTGVGTYEAGALRDYDCSTAAHSTVEVDGENSAEVWGGFRVGRRCVPHVGCWEGTADGFVLEASHGGYRHLACRAVHRRRVVWNGGVLEVGDRVEVSRKAGLVSRIHLAPGVDVRREGGLVVCNKGGVRFTIRVRGADRVELVSRDCCLRFARQEQRTVVEIHKDALPPFAEFGYSIEKSPE